MTFERFNDLALARARLATVLFVLLGLASVYRHDRFLLACSLGPLVGIAIFSAVMGILCWRRRD